MGLYLDNGYLNVDYILNYKCTYNWVIGGRGTGKTFSVLKWMLEHNERFAFMRTKQQTIDNLKPIELSPITPVARYLNKDIAFKNLNGQNQGWYYADDEGKPSGLPFGMTMALSTVASIRGFDASWVDYLVYDEFIPELHEVEFKRQDLAFKNAYETINRNRDIDGGKPLISISLANANRLSTPLLEAMNLTRIIELMIKKGQTEYINHQTSQAVFLLTDSPISKKKRNTSLYKIEDDYTAMALDNAFSFDDTSNMRSYNLKQFKPLIFTPDVGIYVSKTRPLLYVSGHLSGKPKFIYDNSDSDKIRFKREQLGLYADYVDGKVEFENYSMKNKFLALFD